MADVSKIAANGIDYDIKDEAARESIAGMFAQHYESVAAGGTIYLTVPNYETGFIVTIGAYASARGIIIYYCNGQKTVSVTKAAGADGVQTTMSDNQLTLKNNTSAALYVMQFKR